MKAFCLSVSWSGYWNNSQSNGNFPRNLIQGEENDNSHGGILSPQKEIPWVSNNLSDLQVRLSPDKGGPAWVAFLGTLDVQSLTFCLNSSLIQDLGILRVPLTLFPVWPHWQNSSFLLPTFNLLFTESEWLGLTQGQGWDPEFEDSFCRRWAT